MFVNCRCSAVECLLHSQNMGTGTCVHLVSCRIIVDRCKCRSCGLLIAMNVASQRVKQKFIVTSTLEFFELRKPTICRTKPTADTWLDLRLRSGAREVVAPPALWPVLSTYRQHCHPLCEESLRAICVRSDGADRCCPRVCVRVYFLHVVSDIPKIN